MDCRCTTATPPNPLRKADSTACASREAFDTLAPASLLRSLIAAVGMAAESPMGLQASDGCLFALKQYLAPFYELKPTVPMGQGGEGESRAFCRHTNSLGSARQWQGLKGLPGNKVNPHAKMA